MHATQSELEAALQDELSQGRERYDLLPVSLEDLSADGPLAETWVQVATGIQERTDALPPPPIVQAAKWRYGHRPAPAVPLPLRLIYRSATDRLGEFLAADRHRNSYEDFIANSSGAADDGYVLTADIANFYASIDHSILHTELLERSGEPDYVRSVFQALARVGHSKRGLPQGSDVSDRLGDSIAESIEFEMHRAGHHVFRFADDFRIVASTKEDCMRALETLNLACRRRSLMLNERKTAVTPLRALRSIENRKREKAAEPWGGLDSAEKFKLLIGNDIYDIRLVSLQVSLQEADKLKLKALEILESACGQAEDEDATERIPEAQITRALGIFTTSQDPEALRFLRRIVEGSPQLTPSAARYVSACAGTTEASKALDLLANQAFLSDWQKVWLCHCGADVMAAEPNASNMFLEILRGSLLSHNEMVAVGAAWALAHTQVPISSEEVRILSGRLTENSHPSLAAAAGKVSSGDERAPWPGLAERKMFEWGKGA